MGQPLYHTQTAKTIQILTNICRVQHLEGRRSWAGPGCDTKMSVSLTYELWAPIQMYRNCFILTAVAEAACFTNNLTYVKIKIHPPKEKSQHRDRPATSDVTILDFGTISIHRYFMYVIYGMVHFGTIHAFIHVHISSK